MKSYYKVIFPHFPPATQEVIEHFGASPYIFHPESNVSKDFLLEDNPASFMNSSGDITNWSGITCLSQECHMETIINKQNSIWEINFLQRRLSGRFDCANIRRTKSFFSQENFLHYALRSLKLSHLFYLQSLASPGISHK